MTIAMFEPTVTMTTETLEPAELKELVRGQEKHLVEGVGPLVLKHNVTLDLASVERIDAAGIAALVGLYRSAREAGHRFQVTNVSARVAQILELVGLDRFLYSHNAVQNSQYGAQVRRPAA
ncbi:MAG TPA: STAS domain-containing protein [Terracidiphilus sp.]|nr:STAS domain-containing protein [Terracidiphilus sp.]